MSESRKRLEELAAELDAINEKLRPINATISDIRQSHTEALHAAMLEEIAERPDGVWLVQAVATLKKWERDGTMEKIYQKWGRGSYPMGHYANDLDGIIRAYWQVLQDDKPK